ncbi:MAG: MBL fold metallo-hydrolase [Dehalococcoidia bacterium]|nr:MBL fold metallo-hydrolase [Dehalococcoidia bacterium]
MIDIKVLASGSTGNCYRISDGKIPLLIEAGIPIDRIRKGVDFKLSEIQGCLISHAHMDHAKAAKKLMDAGIDCYMSKETAEALKVSGHRLHVLDPNQMHTNIGPWAVISFETEHDAEGSLGFLIMHGDEKILFLTDTAYTRYRFNGLTRIMIECNFDEDIIRENVASGVLHQSLKSRIYANHMSIDRVLDFLKANDLSQCREIWLLHLSDSNSDAEAFKRRVQEATGKIVRVA